MTVASFSFAALGGVAWLGPRSPFPAASETAAAVGLREAIAFVSGDPAALRALFVFPTLAVLLVGPLAPIVLPVTWHARPSAIRWCWA